MNQTPRWKYAAVYAGVATVVVEAVTLAVRFGTGMSAADFNATEPPLILGTPYIILIEMARR